MRTEDEDVLRTSAVSLFGEEYLAVGANMAGSAGVSTQASGTIGRPQ